MAQINDVFIDIYRYIQGADGTTSAEGTTSTLGGEGKELLEEFGPVQNSIVYNIASPLGVITNSILTNESDRH